MPKNSVKQIEQDEKKILEELKKNANKSINDIAEKCGFSRQKVWRVINNLEKNNTIWGYVAIVDEEKLGKKSYIILIKRSNKPMKKEILNLMSGKDFMKRVEKLGIEPLSNIYINGNYDWLIFFNAPDIRIAKGYVEELNRSYEGYISEIHLQEIMFSAQSWGITNPEINKLEDFFKV